MKTAVGIAILTLTFITVFCTNVSELNGQSERIAKIDSLLTKLLFYRYLANG